MKFFPIKYRKLMKARNRNLLLLEITFNILFVVFMIPLINIAFKYVMKLWGHSYVTQKNLPVFLTHPPAILFLLGIFIIVPILVLWKMSSIIHHCRIASINPGPNILSNLAIGFFKTLRSIFTGNIALPFYALIIYLFTNIPLLIGISIKMRFPITFTDGASDVLFLRGLFTLFLVFITFIAYRGLFTVHFCINENQKFLDGLEHSKQLMMGRHPKTATTLLLYNVFLTVGFYLIYNIILFIMAVLIYFSVEKNMVITIFLSYYPMVNLYIALLFSMISFITNLNLISSLYRTYREEEGRDYDGSILNYQEEETTFLPMKGHRQLLIAILVMFLSAGLINFYIAVRNDSFHLQEALSGIQIASHRGSSFNAPENTLPAIEQAIAAHSDYAEIDVQQTKDGVLILLHDKNLWRTTGLNKYIWTQTYDDIKDLDAGSWFGDEYAGTPIPTLEEALELSKGRIKLNIDVKIHGHEQEIEQKLVALIEEYDFEHQCIVSSWSYDTVARVKQLNTDIKTGYILSAAYGNFYDKEFIDFLSIRSAFITKSVVENTHLAGKEIHAWTVNAKSELERMKSLGVNSIITDNPILAKEILLRDDTNDTIVELLHKMLLNRSFYQIVRK
ncbi:glycerophosphodiester phosphodiesterase [Mobilitalea sibirica]|uniref:Glycerophosphodiester phosphodiesterase n=1 Tax=Mobilitalea sibirica TaxID=1462919 RepID=A0A8J7H1R9_9FIRM|nr:glycerophosphodiester phosphodiesterase [Mobilitalea sibirica]MBH1940438.1 glycerophosphodiester phosphodiesterase [Mobilitalea sibirica]